MHGLLAVSIAVGTLGCGAVSDSPHGIDAAPSPDAPPPTRTFRGTLERTAEVAFGGSPYCNYTITLKQLEVALEIRASGEITGGTVHDLNLETSVPPCPYPPVDPSIASYTLQTATPDGDGVQLTFEGAPANEPTVALTGQLLAGGVKLAFARTDASGVLAWTVHATVMLAAP